ncbi:hypothetical protein J7E32_04345 [Bacillus sp. ISL-55]|nr:hypothetical protein [Bacillus sp. ISL-55]
MTAFRRKWPKLSRNPRYCERVFRRKSPKLSRKHRYCDSFQVKEAKAVKKTPLL